MLADVPPPPRPAVDTSAHGRAELDGPRDRARRPAALRLTRWLQAGFSISASNVIGHAESLSSPYHRENVVRLRRQTHGDWPATLMRRYRARL